MRKSNPRSRKVVTRSSGTPILKKAVLRSGLEDKVAANLDALGVAYTYEASKHPYLIPARKAKYIEDFAVGPFIIEVKGYFDTDDRKKMVLLKEQSPDLDIRLLFQRATNKLGKNSPTTYAKWCDDHGIKWAECGKEGRIPAEWIAEAQRYQEAQSHP